MGKLLQKFVGPGTFKIEINSENAIITQSKIQVLVDSTLGAVTLQLPSIQSIKNAAGVVELTIFDLTGTAATNNITLQADALDKVNNAGTEVINVNKGSLEIETVGPNAWSAEGGSGGGGTPLPNNPFDFYLDNTVAVDGDGSIEKPFKLLTSLNNAVLALANPTQSYVSSVAPSDQSYGQEVVGFLSIAPNLSLIGLTPQDTAISCDIHLVAGATGVVNQYRQIAFNGIFTLDLALATFAAVTFLDGVVNINRIDSNGSGFVIMQGGISGSTILGCNVIIQGGVMFGDVNIGPGAQVFASNMLGINGKFKLTGNCVFKTLTTLNPQDGYVDGTVDGSGTPTWNTDAASDAKYTGTLNKNVLGGEGLIPFHKSLSAAQIKTLFSARVQILPDAGVGYAYQFESGTAFIKFNGVQFDVGNFLNIICGGIGAVVPQAACSIIGATADCSERIAIGGSGPNNIQVVENGGLYISADADSTVGDGTIEVYGTYRTLKLG